MSAPVLTVVAVGERSTLTIGDTSFTSDHRTIAYLLERFIPVLRASPCSPN